MMRKMDHLMSVYILDHRRHIECLITSTPRPRINESPVLILDYRSCVKPGIPTQTVLALHECRELWDTMGMPDPAYMQQWEGHWEDMCKAASDGTEEYLVLGVGPIMEARRVAFLQLAPLSHFNGLYYITHPIAE